MSIVAIQIGRLATKAPEIFYFQSLYRIILWENDLISRHKVRQRQSLASGEDVIKLSPELDRVGRPMIQTWQLGRVDRHRAGENIHGLHRTVCIVFRLFRKKPHLGKADEECSSPYPVTQSLNLAVQRSIPIPRDLTDSKTAGSSCGVLF